MHAFSSLLLLSSLTSLALAAPDHRFTKHIRREVPQEHSHEATLRTVRTLLQQDNPLGIVDPVFGLLGNAAAIGGANGVDPDCLQQATADQAFTNAKAAGDIPGQTAALIFRALERNTVKVGLASVPCTAIKATNPEIAALSQHQDPASTGAAAINKAITLELARQIASIGGDPQDALLSGTFAPGDVNDPTARGNSCDDENDAAGCIFTQNLIVDDATAAEIDAAVAADGGAASSVAASSPAATTTAVAATSTAAAATLTSAAEANVVTQTATVTVEGVCTATSVPSTSTVTVTVTAPCSGDDAVATTSTSAAAAASTTAAAATGNNLQTFTGALGGIAAPTVTEGGRGFQVEGNDSFLNLSAALGRSCDVQHNKCANASNAGLANHSVGDCDAQNNECNALRNGTRAKKLRRRSERW